MIEFPKDFELVGVRNWYIKPYTDNLPHGLAVYQECEGIYHVYFFWTGTKLGNACWKLNLTVDQVNQELETEFANRLMAQLK